MLKKIFQITGALVCITFTSFAVVDTIIRISDKAKEKKKKEKIYSVAKRFGKRYILQLR